MLVKAISAQDFAEFIRLKSLTFAKEGLLAITKPAMKYKFPDY